MAHRAPCCPIAGFFPTHVPSDTDELEINIPYSQLISIKTRKGDPVTTLAKAVAVKKLVVLSTIVMMFSLFVRLDIGVKAQGSSEY